MKKSRKKNTDKNQMMFEIFVEQVSHALSLQGGSQESLSDFEFGLRKTLKTVLEDAGKRDVEPLDRVEIAARMTRLLGRDITKTTIDQWIAMSAIQKRLHVDALKAICEVLDDWRPLHFFVEACGFKALQPEEAIYAEYGAQMMLRRMLDNDIKSTVSKADEAQLRENLVRRLTTQKGAR